MTVIELIHELNKYRNDDPVVIEVDNNGGEFSEKWLDTYDFEVTTEKLDEDYTEIRLRLIPN